MRLRCRFCHNEFDFPYEVFRNNLHGNQIIYPKHCKTCFSELNSKEQIDLPAYPGKGGGRIPQEYNPDWPKARFAISQYHVYILSMTSTQGVEFYVGHTENIHDRLFTHLSDQNRSTQFKHPKLVWFCEVATRQEATQLEAELKGVNEQNNAIIKDMVLSFKDLARQLDYPAFQTSA
jgi:predicted GIY-YIG superfamily endonuclease